MDRDESSPMRSDGRPKMRRRRSSSEETLSRGARSYTRSHGGGLGSPHRRSRAHPSSPRRRRREASSSRESRSASSSPSAKRARSIDSDHNERNSSLLNKVLSILDKARSSDKPKLTYNSNVLPEFDPLSKDQTVLMWIKKVEECAEMYGWDEREIIHYSLPKLCGVAKTWYQSLTSVSRSWSDWKKKLLESFPYREDYAELLTEMLAKEARYGDSLEHYYYEKQNLLNRCNITGKRAVDCILYGIVDRATRVGAQAFQFMEPEQVLQYFKTVRVSDRKPRYGASSSRADSVKYDHTVMSKPKKQLNTTIRCYNCNEIGHPSFKCEKTADTVKCHNCDEMGHRSGKCKQPPSKCAICDRLGHLTEHCYRKGSTSTAVDNNTTPSQNNKARAGISVDKWESCDGQIRDGYKDKRDYYK